MATEYTHFKYLCRVCKTEFFVPINQEDPAKTPHPAHCGSQRNPAYKAPVTIGLEGTPHDSDATLR